MEILLCVELNLTSPTSKSSQSADCFWKSTKEVGLNSELGQSFELLLKISLIHLLIKWIYIDQKGEGGVGKGEN